MVIGGFYSQPSYIESVSATTLSPSVQLGAVRTEDGEEYLYVYNGGGASITAGYGCAVLSGSSGYSVTVTSVAAADSLVGFCKHATFATLTYGWLLTKGYTAVKNGMADTAIVAGALLVPDADGALRLPTGASTCVVVGRAITATGSAGACRAFVRVWGS